MSRNQINLSTTFWGFTKMANSAKPANHHEAQRWQKPLTVPAINYRLDGTGYQVKVAEVWDEDRATYVARFYILEDGADSGINATDLSGLLNRMTTEFGSRQMASWGLTKETVNPQSKVA